MHSFSITHSPDSRYERIARPTAVLGLKRALPRAQRAARGSGAAARQQHLRQRQRHEHSRVSGRRHGHEAGGTRRQQRWPRARRQSLEGAAARARAASAHLLAARRRPVPRPAAAATATAAAAGSRRDLPPPLRGGAARVVVPVSVREGSISRGSERQRASSWRAGGGGAPSEAPLRCPEGTPEVGDSNSWSSDERSSTDDRAEAAEQPSRRPVKRYRRGVVEVDSALAAAEAALLLPMEVDIEAVLLASSAAAPSPPLLCCSRATDGHGTVLRPPV